MFRKNLASGLMVLTFVLLLALWQWLSSQGELDAVRIVSELRRHTQAMTPLALAAFVIPVYLLLLHLMFPLTVLVAATGLLFGPWAGFLYAGLGTLVFAATSFWLGSIIGPNVLFRLGGERLHDVSRYLAQRGVRVVFLLSLLPLAPFALSNMLAGASHIRFRDYMLGSAAGLLPGVAVVTVLGGELGALLESGGQREILLFLLFAVVLLAGFFAIRARVMARYGIDGSSE